MPNGCIYYRAGYEYQLARDYTVYVGGEIRPAADIAAGFLALTRDGWLSMRCGYAWDGPSGPTLDTATGMRGSLVHDALYQLIRGQHLGRAMRAPADRVFYRILREDEMLWLRARYWYRGVRLGGGPSADPANHKPVLLAPAGCVALVTGGTT